MTLSSGEQERIEQRHRELREFGASQTLTLETGASYQRVTAPKRSGEYYRCPCCYYKTLAARGNYEVCPVCFWEDDGQDDVGANLVLAGPNHALSLLQARHNYRQIGACDQSSLAYVRPPLSEEL